MATTCFTQMNVWKSAHQVVLAVYKLTENFPVRERYGLAQQMRRAAVSIPANLAEGYGRRKEPDKARFYNISQASAEEIKYYFILCRDLALVAEIAPLQATLDQTLRMLRSLVEVVSRGRS